MAPPDMSESMACCSLDVSNYKISKDTQAMVPTSRRARDRYTQLAHEARPKVYEVRATEREPGRGRLRAARRRRVILERGASCTGGSWCRGGVISRRCATLCTREIPMKRRMETGVTRRRVRQVR